MVAAGKWATFAARSGPDPRFPVGQGLAVIPGRRPGPGRASSVVEERRNARYRWAQVQGRSRASAGLLVQAERQSSQGRRPGGSAPERAWYVAPHATARCARLAGHRAPSHAMAGHPCSPPKLPRGNSQRLPRDGGSHRVRKIGTRAHSVKHLLWTRARRSRDGRFDGRELVHRRDYEMAAWPIPGPRKWTSRPPPPPR